MYKLKSKNHTDKCLSESQNAMLNTISGHSFVGSLVTAAVI